jgi:hypothetical protein
MGISSKGFSVALKLDKLCPKGESAAVAAGMGHVEHSEILKGLPEQVRQLFLYVSDNPWDDETLIHTSPSIWISTWMAGFSEEWATAHGIDTILNASFELQPPDWTCKLPAYLHLPIMDEESFSQFDLFQQAADFIHHNISAGRSMLVHCSAGESRSVTSLLAYFIVHRREGLAATLGRIRSIRHRAYPNIGFFLYLLALERHILGQQSIPVAALLLHRNFATSSFAETGLAGLQEACDDLQLKLRNATMKATDGSSDGII